MSYLVTITQEAEEDLGGIYSYITFSLLSPQNAKGQIDRIQKVIQSLSLIHISEPTRRPG